jgi:hypothetical protein
MFIGAAGGAAGNGVDSYEDHEGFSKILGTAVLGAVTGAVSNVSFHDGLGPSLFMGGLSGYINGAGSQLIGNGGNIRKVNWGWVAADTAIGAAENAVGTGIQGDNQDPTLGNSISAFMGVWPGALCGGLDASQKWDC